MSIQLIISLFLLICVQESVCDNNTTNGSKFFLSKDLMDWDQGQKVNKTKIKHAIKTCSVLQNLVHGTSHLSYILKCDSSKLVRTTMW